jgi:hypothetical protein
MNDGGGQQQQQPGQQQQQPGQQQQQPGQQQQQPAGGDWVATLDADSRAFVGVKGWKTPTDVISSYANLEKTVGADKIVLPGKDAKPEQWDGVYKALGRPDKPDGYELKKPEGFDGYSDDLAKAYRDTAHKAGLSASQAATLHDWWAGAAMEANKREVAEREADAKKMDGELRTAWGAAYDGNVEAGKRGVQHFAKVAGLTADQAAGALDAFEKRIGGAALMRMFAAIGKGIGEDTLHGSGLGGTMTPEQAKLEITKIEKTEASSKILTDKTHPEHAALVERRAALYKLAYPEQQK